jgi:hypothetical protein
MHWLPVQVITVTDVFAKQLMCMRLMTPERTKAIIAVYPTVTRYACGEQHRAPGHAN